MKKLTISLENCYGIKKLDASFDFGPCKAYAIYAPNGVMKSSLAQTFRDAANGESSEDRIFTDRVSKRSFTIDGGAELPPDDILVLAPFDEDYEHTEKTSTLLVDAKLRKEFEALHSQVEDATEKLIKALKKQSGTKRDIESEVSSVFTRRNDQFLLALQRIQKEVQGQKDSVYADIEYDTLFDDKAQALLNDKDFKSAVEDYVKKYNELLDKSIYFSRDTFDYYNAGTIAKALTDQGFFKAKHTVNLRSSSNSVLEISDQKQLQAIIEDEKKAIIQDAELRKRFSSVQKLIQKNAQLREFENYLQHHETLLSKLANPEALKEEIWKSYLKANESLFIELLDKAAATAKRKAEIVAEANKQRTQWESVIDIFNDRFFVPFRLEAQNRVPVMLGQESLLRLGFVFTDGKEEVSVQKETLMRSLSTGEKKAFYILNVIFEIEARAQTGRDTILVVDDIADSFDYKNKYAIIQYLSDIAKREHFDELLLTHNFDFFRTVQSRFVAYNHCLMAEKTDTEIVLRKATGIKNVFVHDWKKEFGTNARKRIACIPFIRNIIEYTRGENDLDYERLTSLLHWKADSQSITQADLDAIYNRTFTGNESFSRPKQFVVNSIFEEAEQCINSKAAPSLENKILLAIAIRLKIEQFMISKISDTHFVGGISSNQTQKLQEKFKQKFPSELKSIGIIDRVLLMTPENIHLNSFMYEPLVDMSDDHLRKLYGDVLSIK